MNKYTHKIVNIFGETVTQRTRVGMSRAIEEVLHENPKARDDNMALLAGVWRKQGYDIPEDFEQVAFDAETLTRTVRKLKENK